MCVGGWDCDGARKGVLVGDSLRILATGPRVEPAFESETGPIVPVSLFITFTVREKMHNNVAIVELACGFVSIVRTKKENHFED